MLIVMSLAQRSALSNGGGIRSFIAAGNITYENTLAVFPYGNMACLIEVTGQQLKDALEMASKNYPQESVGFLQVSGGHTPLTAQSRPV